MDLPNKLVIQMAQNNETCLANDEREGSWRYQYYFDDLPPAARRALNYSRLNICPACFYDRWGEVFSACDNSDVAAAILVRAFELAIEGGRAPEYYLPTLLQSLLT